MGSIWRGFRIRDEALRAIRTRSSVCLVVISMRRVTSAAVSREVASGSPAPETLRSSKALVPIWWYLMSQVTLVS